MDMPNGPVVHGRCSTDQAPLEHVASQAQPIIAVQGCPVLLLPPDTSLGTEHSRRRSRHLRQGLHVYLPGRVRLRPSHMHVCVRSKSSPITEQADAHLGPWLAGLSRHHVVEGRTDFAALLVRLSRPLPSFLRLSELAYFRPQRQTPLRLFFSTRKEHVGPPGRRASTSRLPAHTSHGTHAHQSHRLRPTITASAWLLLSIAGPSSLPCLASQNILIASKPGPHALIFWNNTILQQHERRP